VRGGGETGEAEVWVAGPSSEAARIGEALEGAGARPIGTVAFESLRIEAGTPLFGSEADGSVLLPEIPFQNLVSETKGCYPGQEVVVRIRDRGHVNRLLRGLVLEGDAVPPIGAEVVAGEAAVGKVTSSTWSFGLQRPIALAFVRRQHAEPGSQVAVRVDGRTVAASVRALPFER
jgi:folate-binding protein YgfZ